VSYNGFGSYFLDRIRPGVWRLELYPDVVIVEDPFKGPTPNKVVSRIVCGTRNIGVRLPDLGKDFEIHPLNDANEYKTTAEDGEFKIQPGVYLLINREENGEDLPQEIDGVGLREFHVPKPHHLPAQLVHNPPEFGSAGDPLQLTATVVDENPNPQVTLHWREKGKHDFKSLPMIQTDVYSFFIELPGEAIMEGVFEYAMVVGDGPTARMFPGNAPVDSSVWGIQSDAFWELQIFQATVPRVLLRPIQDGGELDFTRIDHAIQFEPFRLLPRDQSEAGAVRISLPPEYASGIDDLTVSYYVRDRLRGIQSGKLSGQLLFDARGLGGGDVAYVTLVEADGTAWSSRLQLGTEWQNHCLPVVDFEISEGVMLPLGYPGRWNYWLRPPEGRGGIGDYPHLDQVERIQISIRSREINDSTSNGVEIGAIYLDYFN